MEISNEVSSTNLKSLASDSSRDEKVNKFLDEMKELCENVSYEILVQPRPPRLGETRRYIIASDNSWEFQELGQQLNTTEDKLQYIEKLHTNLTILIQKANQTNHQLEAEYKDLDFEITLTKRKGEYPVKVKKPECEINPLPKPVEVCSLPQSLSQLDIVTILYSQVQAEFYSVDCSTDPDSDEEPPLVIDLEAEEEESELGSSKLCIKPVLSNQQKFKSEAKNPKQHSKPVRVLKRRLPQTRSSNKNAKISPTFNSEDENTVKRYCSEQYPKLLHPGSTTLILGPNGTTLPQVDYEAMQWKSAAGGTRELLSLLFDDIVLATSSLSGNPSPAFRGRERPPKGQLDPIKVEDIIHLVCSKFNISRQMVRAAITTKCADTTKKYKKTLKNIFS